ncbi:hypothetical protein TorRG33x02_348850 [Trema orientale]|uniref:Uncharacterized protein n=1 Tax=Trema orientale TaxID=63057 RepID=A0A2P5AJG4_TREOI|nr:hypothetical protein TorRG33x02_348850 [Trema orientale]
MVENGKVELDNEVLLSFTFRKFEFIAGSNDKEVEMRNTFELTGVGLDFNSEQQIDSDSKRHIEEIGRGDR